jgi:hypothetical protein
MYRGVAELQTDQTQKSADTIEACAHEMLPSCSFHVQPAYVVELLACQSLDEADANLTAALVRAVWSGGKVGFPMLPDPRQQSIAGYRVLRDELLGWLGAPTPSNEQGIRALLTGEDLEFFDSLPTNVTVYRGVAGLSGACAAEGPCWTLDADLAGWFADRAAGFCRDTPRVVAAHVRVPTDVWTVFAHEQEIVTVPGHYWEVQRA